MFNLILVILQPCSDNFGMMNTEMIRNRLTDVVPDPHARFKAHLLRRFIFDDILNLAFLFWRKDFVLSCRAPTLRWF